MSTYIPRLKKEYNERITGALKESIDTKALCKCRDLKKLF